MLAQLVGEIDSRLEMLARDQHSSLFIESVNFGEKGFITSVPFRRNR
jgi:hypothetical protein